MSQSPAISVSVKKGENPKLPFSVTFASDMGALDMVLGQTLKMAARRQGTQLGDHQFYMTTEEQKPVTKADFATADDATAALQLLNQTLNGLADRSIPKAEIFPGDFGASIPLVTLAHIPQAKIEVRTLVQQLTQEKN